MLAGTLLWSCTPQSKSVLGANVCLKPQKAQKELVDCMKDVLTKLLISSLRFFSPYISFANLYHTMCELSTEYGCIKLL